MSTIRVFGTKFEADTAKALLANNDIGSEVFGDPAYSVAPHHVTEPGFDLMVLDRELDRALEVLGPVSSEVDELEAAYYHRRFADRPTWIKVATYALILTLVLLVILPAVLRGLEIIF